LGKMQTLTEKYVASVYWSFTTMTTVGYGDISAKTVAERVFAIVGMLMGGFVLSAIISKLVLVVEEADLGKKAMKKKLLMVEEWVKDLHLPKDYRVRVLNHFRNQVRHPPYYSEHAPPPPTVTSTVVLLERGWRSMGMLLVGPVAHPYSCVDANASRKLPS